MRYYIIGTDHKLQKANNSKNGLKTLLKTVIDNLDVVLVAEEVDANQDVVTSGRNLAGEEKWLSIDMNADERKRAGIYDILKHDEPAYDDATGELMCEFYRDAESKREEFWLDKIAAWCKERKISSGTVVVTCGMNHRFFLAEKAAKRGHEADVNRYITYDYESVWGRLRVK